MRACFNASFDNGRAVSIVRADGVDENFSLPRNSFDFIFAKSSSLDSRSRSIWVQSLEFLNDRRQLAFRPACYCPL